MGERAPLLAKAVGGKVLGPRPGLAIVSFWQGILEIVLRTLALVSCIALIVPGALSTIKIDDTDKDTSVKEVRSLGKAVCGIVIVSGVIGVALELVIIILRFINVGLINLKIKYFLLADVLLMAGLIFIFIIGGVGTAVSSKQWSTHHQYTSIAHSIGAASAISFFSMVVFVILAAYMLAFIFNKWNKQVIVYTLKDAVLG